MTRRLGLVVGTRPNFVKAAAVIHALEKRGVKPVLIHTGQHHDAKMSDAFFSRLQLPEPDHHLGVGAGSRGAQMGRIIEKLSELLPSLKLDELIVVGDVTSTAAAALAADALDLPVAHVEAGLRSFDITMPEERNRKVVDAIAARLLVSEPSGVKNLEREGHPASRVQLVGNVMIDTLRRFEPAARAMKVHERFGLERGKYAVATLHRPANVDAPEALNECLKVLGATARRWPVLFAVHPRTRARLTEGKQGVPESVKLLEPLDYLEFIGLMSEAKVVLTDSGGAQEETTALGVPCLTMRENTERPITCELGTSRLVGRDLAKAEQSLAEIERGSYPRGAAIPLWDGRAAERIAELLVGTA